MAEPEPRMPVSSADEDIGTLDWSDEPEDTIKQSCLHNKYTFWFHRRGGPQAKSSYEDSILKVETCQTVEHFWRIYDHFIRPNEIKYTVDYHLFKEGIKPTWEDAANKNGGKWMIRVKKGLSSHYWEELILAIIGEQFDVGHELCGAVLSIRNGEDIISIWNKNTDNMEATNKIRDQMRRILKLPTFVAIEYKKHQDSLVDNSSFRNPTLVWRAPVRNDNKDHHSYHNNNNSNQHNNNQYQGNQGNYHHNRDNYQAGQGGNQGPQGQGYVSANSPRGGPGAPGFQNRNNYNSANAPVGIKDGSPSIGAPRPINSTSTSSTTSPRTADAPAGFGGAKPSSRWDALSPRTSSGADSAAPALNAPAAASTTVAAGNPSTSSGTSPRATTNAGWRSGAGGTGGGWNRSTTSSTDAPAESSDATKPAVSTAPAGAPISQASMGKNLGGWVKSQLMKTQDDSEHPAAKTPAAVTAVEEAPVKPKFAWKVPNPPANPSSAW